MLRVPPKRHCSDPEKFVSGTTEKVVAKIVKLVLECLIRLRIIRNGLQITLMGMLIDKIGLKDQETDLDLDFSLSGLIMLARGVRFVYSVKPVFAPSLCVL